ncbi:MAG TPA: amino acid permease [Ornithinicoccus sp.]|nr:amino acid permease [Ornithinicoccus sp.]
MVSFLIAGLAAGLSALCYAEMASSIPVSGSTYSYAYHAMGELVAVHIAGCVLLEYGVAASAVAVGWSGYFNELLSSTIGVELPDALSASFIQADDAVTPASSPCRRSSWCSCACCCSSAARPSRRGSTRSWSSSSSPCSCSSRSSR